MAKTPKVTQKQAPARKPGLQRPLTARMQASLYYNRKRRIARQA